MRAFANVAMTKAQRIIRQRTREIIENLQLQVAKLSQKKEVFDKALTT